MAALDRGEIVRLLERLGDPAESEALAAARTLHRTIQEAGVAWDTLLVDSETTEEAAAPDLPGDPPEPPQGLPPGETNADLALIERMLASFDLSETTRDDLAGLNGLHSRLSGKR